MAATSVCLVGFAEVVAAPEVCLSFMRSNARIVSFDRQKGGGRFARLNFVKHVPVTAPEADFESNVSKVEALADLVEPVWMAPCGDVSVLVQSRLRQAKARGLLVGPSACDFAMDKRAQIPLAAASGFFIPQTKLIRSEADMAEFDARPAFMKPQAALDMVNAWLERILNHPAWQAALVLNPDTEVNQDCLTELMA
jgi:hypothetical protein